jgi:outer membrane murein-binding lipoprotein Lpp
LHVERSNLVPKRRSYLDTVHNVSSKLTVLEEKMDAAIDSQQSWKWKCYQEDQIEKVANKIDDVNAKLDKLIEKGGPIG